VVERNNQSFIILAPKRQDSNYYIYNQGRHASGKWHGHFFGNTAMTSKRISKLLKSSRSLMKLIAALSMRWRCVKLTALSA